ncbi:imelysin family protein [Tumidithrix elongata RA019]|uniref:Imelysin family protein n=1 Tax=Tumidithrix elongata BACA0141 TaxID=2716417 RepID=A0AAW9PXT7_9CYAN|nr:imelysin family protein [Tumidithrix elongata RA019]
MKRFRFNLKKIAKKIASIALVTSFLTIACSQPNATTSIAPTVPKIANASAVIAPAKFSDRQVVVDFADRVVIPTYQTFASKTKDLRTAIEAFATNPNEQTLKAAQDAWMAARVPWEQGESFTIGPAKSYGLDAAIDTWPLDKSDVERILKSGDRITPEVVQNLQESQKGFHTIEFLLFGSEGKKAIADFTPREFDYLKAATVVLDADANKLLTAWTQGIDGRAAYRDSFATAGNNPVYPSLPDAAQEMVEGIIDSTTEVAEKKIGEPFTKKDAKAIESQYAIANPLNDFRSNLNCVKNVYFGATENHTLGKSGISAFVAKVKPDLDARVEREIKLAIAAIDEIPTPFQTAIADASAADKIKQAIAAVTTVKETFEKEVKPLIVQ